MKRLFLLSLLTVLSIAQSGQKNGFDRAMLDPACKPCDDFFRYATGGWVDANPIPANQARWGTFNQLREANWERLTTILNTAAANPSATGDAKRMGDFYAACLNTAAIEAAGVKPLQPQLDRIAAIRTRENLRELLTDPDIGMNPVGSMADPDNTLQTIASVGAGGLSLPDRDYYFRDDAQSKKIREEFLIHVQRQLESLGDSVESAAATSRLVLEFETALANATLTNVVRRDPYQTIHKMEFAKMAELVPSYDWQTAFKVLNAPTTGLINVAQPEFLREVDRQVREAPLDTWKGWLRWRLVSNRAPYLSKNFFDEDFRFNRTVLSGVNEQLPRWQICAQSVDATFGDALGKLYVEKYFPAEAQRQMRDLVENLRASLGEQLQSADWLEEETRKNALRKLENFDPRVGFPVKWRAYDGVEVSRDGYLNSKASAIREQRMFVASKIGKETDRTAWTMTAPTVNANYMPLLNAITFPAGILQFPFFDMNADPALNYGAIGAVIGHEMGHGFDDQGSKFDADGNLKDWWTNSDRAKFETRAACITNQFDSIDVGDGMRHTGKLVTGEAMGDLGGLTLAYKAYRRSLAGKEAPMIDGFTGDQRFFLAFARVWAGSQRPDDQRRQLATDPHALAKYRANATLQNMPEFHQAFACKRGDPMVRPAEQQCKLW